MALSIRTSRSKTARSLPSENIRLQLVQLTATHNAHQQLCQDIYQGLIKTEPKQIPPTYFYDAHGSMLYEAITDLPEYYPTRTEASLLQQSVSELLGHLGHCPEWVELGSGSSSKTRILLDAWSNTLPPLTYIPVDVSDTSVIEASRLLIHQYPRLQVSGLIGQYEAALDYLQPKPNRCFLFLGSTMGNFTPHQQAAFIDRLVRAMAPGNLFLLGFDRRPNEQKPQSVIEAAYNDAQGVTAAFNLNVLSRLNRELGANFMENHWCHRAFYNEDDHQIEMYLESQQDQSVSIADLKTEVTFKQGERILTEISRKYDPNQLAHWFKPHGLKCIQHWTDKNQYFGLMLLSKQR